MPFVITKFKFVRIFTEVVECRARTGEFRSQTSHVYLPCIKREAGGFLQTQIEY